VYKWFADDEKMQAKMPKNTNHNDAKVEGNWMIDDDVTHYNVYQPYSLQVSK